MNKSNDALQTQSKPNDTRSTSHALYTDGKSCLTPVSGIAPWLARANLNVKRMYNDEAYRQEIARKIS